MTVLPTAVVDAAPVQAVAVAVQTEAFDESAAAALASAQGTRVEVSRLRSQTDQVFKNPDGTTTRDQYLEPVRVRRGASWVPVDSTLIRAVDGSLVPAASATDMAFSPGGSGPLVTMAHDGVRLALTWQSPLPAPILSGPSATYPEVFPGVDLVMTSVGMSFTQHLIVKTAAAGQQPGVRSLTLGTRVTGGRMVATPGGGFQVLDRDAHPVWSSPAPSMWDSSADTAGQAPAAPATAPAGGATAPAVTPTAAPRLGQDGARDGDKVKAMGESVGATSMVLTPDATMLDSSATVYPVTIDPTTTPTVYSWAMVNKTFPTTSYSNYTDADQGVGYNDYAGINTKRLFYSFVTSGYLGKTVTAASLYLFETYSATCAAGTVDAYLTSNYAYGMTWNTQPPHASAILDSFSIKAGRSGCSPNYPSGYTAEFKVASGVQSRVAQGYTVTTFGLQGRSESNDSSWMRFAGPKNATVNHRPKLSVTYNSTPSTPSTSTMFAPGTTVPCATTAATSKRFNQTSSTAFEIATGVDSDGGSLTMEFSLFNAATGLHQNDNFITASSGTAFKFKVPGTWGDGGYYWKVRVKDALVYGGWSANCYITLDKTAPATPTIESSTFTADTLAPEDLTAGTFTFASVGATSFDYYWNGVLQGNLKTNGTSSTGAPAWIGSRSLPASMVGSLQVMAIDATGNHSPMSATFYVKKAVSGKLAQYLFNDPTTAVPSPTTVLDSARDGGAEDPIAPADVPRYMFNLTTGGAWDVGRFADPTCWDPQAGWTCAGVQNRSLLLDGVTPGQEAVSPQRPVVSERSFTIGTWVKLTSDDQSRTLIAQNLLADVANPTAATYDIGYDQVSDKFVFHVSDTAGNKITAVDALPTSLADPNGGPPIVLPHRGAWVYLAAIYDATAGTIRLDAAHEYDRDPLGDPNSTWVHVTNGLAAPLTAGAVVQAGLGAFQVGAGGVGTAPWAGMVDNVSVWQRTLSDATTINDVTTNANAHI